MRSAALAIGLLLPACAEPVEWRAGSAEEARAAATLLSRFGYPADVSASSPGVLALPAEVAPAAIELLVGAGFGAPGPAPEPRLVRGPTEARRAAEDEERRRLETALLATPGVLRAQVLEGGAVALFHVPGEDAELASAKALVHAALGPAARLSLHPVSAPPPRPPAPRASLELPLALLCLALALMLGLVVRQARRRAPA